jgi:transcription elongation GreA/GreB family factor
MGKKKFDTVDGAVAHYEALLDEANEAYKKLSESAEKAAKEIVRLVSEIDDLKAKLKTAGDDATKAVKAKLQAAEDRLAELEEDLEAEKTTAAEALEQMAEMGTKLSLLEKHKGSDCEFVTIAGQEYKLIGKFFRTRKGRLSVEELAKDPELLEEMLEKKSGSLQLAE